MPPLFTCKLQLAKHGLDETIDKGEVDFQQFRAQFNAVDWEFEADRLQFLQKTWPAIGVTNNESGAVLWTSAYRPLPPEFLDEDKFRQNMAIWFIVRLDYPPNPPEITRLDSGEELFECYFTTVNPGEIEDLFSLFFESDYDSLYESLFSMGVAQVET
jgi:hypothetical protein